MYSDNSSAFFIHFPGMYSKERYALNFAYTLIGKELNNYYNITASQILEEFEEVEYKSLEPIVIVFWIMISIIIVILLFYLTFR